MPEATTAIVSQATADQAKAAHTPGPWSVHDQIAVWQGPADAPSVPLASCDTGYRSWARHIEWDEHVANARLIAAAPDMLEQLREVALSFSTIKAAYQEGRLDFTLAEFARIVVNSTMVEKIIAEAEGRS